MTMMIQPSIERTAIALEWVVMEAFLESCLGSTSGASTSISVSAMVAVLMYGLKVCGCAWFTMGCVVPQ